MKTHSPARNACKVLMICLWVVPCLLAEAQPFFYQPSQLKIWRERTGFLPGKLLYNSPGDVAPGSPGDWQRIASQAALFLKDPLPDRYTNFYQGAGCFPTEQKHGASFQEVHAVQPLKKGDQLLCAAFFYLLTELETYAMAVQRELLHYLAEPSLDAADSSRFCTDLRNSVSDHNHFFLAGWYGKLLQAYDYTRHSAAYQPSEHRQIREWHLAAARYFQAVVVNDLANVIPGFWKGDFTVMQSTLHEAGWLGSKQTDQGFLYDGGPLVYNISRQFNNRRTAQVRYLFTVGLYFGDPQLVETGKAYFKAAIALGLLEEDCLHADFYRAVPGNHEAGYTYAATAITDLIHMADAYAKVYDDALYRFTTSKVEMARFCPAVHSKQGWYQAVAVEGKSLQKAIQTHLVMVTGEGHWQRFGEKIDGRASVTDNQGGKYEAFYLYHIWFLPANQHFRNPEWAAILEGRDGRALFPLPPTIAHGPGIYWNNPWVGATHDVPGFMLMYAGLSGDN
jgi:hypothetical protein